MRERIVGVVVAGMMMAGATYGQTAVATQGHR